jgi:hypothetical protein
MHITGTGSYECIYLYALIQEAFPATQLQRTPSAGSECGESPYGASPLNSNSDFAAKAAAAAAAATAAVAAAAAAAEHVYSSSSDSDTDNDDDISSSAQGLRERLLQRKALQSVTSTSITAAVTADDAGGAATGAGSSTTR